MPLAVIAAQPLNEFLEIRADAAEFNQQEGFAAYKGHVNLTQGNRKILADELRVYRQNRKVSYLVAMGKPAKFFDDSGEFKVEANAEKITYRLDAQRMILEGKGRLTHDDSVFEGNRIEYDLNNRVLRASGAPASQTAPAQRVHMRIPTESTTNDPSGKMEDFSIPKKENSSINQPNPTLNPSQTQNP